MVGVQSEGQNDWYHFRYATHKGKTAKSEQINIKKLEQDHPCVISLIRQKYLRQPAEKDLPYQLNHPEVTDPSDGQSKAILRILQNKAINLYFVYNINISLKSVFEIHVANLLHHHCQLTPGIEDDLPYGKQMRVYQKVRISRRKRKITTKMEGRFPIGFNY
ncbi:hypothetical protein OUZ56_011544 [Daphnia magna]|uniref:Uncharacterized protein n=1 Tax=Daphnia magna TaxID=35525 RepID=A0ABQ9Z0H0_9CRUS|nr:hypothetical protein OUZ56_011544 [Daphnia magna]